MPRHCAAPTASSTATLPSASRRPERRLAITAVRQTSTDMKPKGLEPTPSPSVTPMVKVTSRVAQEHAITATFSTPRRAATPPTAKQVLSTAQRVASKPGGEAPGCRA